VEARRDVGVMTPIRRTSPPPPHHAPHGVHGHAPRPHHKPHLHEVFYNLEEAASPTEYSALLASFARQVSETGDVGLTDGISVAVPQQSHLTVCFERTPHGTLALRVSVEWHDAPSDGQAIGSLAELIR
jgi:hypothetical protein